MEIIWSEKATRKRGEIFDFIALDNIDSAINLDFDFENAADSLEQFPDKGRIGQIPGTRELIIHHSYLLIYRRLKDVIEIITIHHTSQQHPSA